MERNRVVLICGPGRTKQSFKEQCDINCIVERYKQSGLVSHVNSKQGTYADVSSVPDYQTALNTVNVARDAFNSLPATVRARFNNDPGMLLDFLSKPENIDEGVRLGLLVKKVDPTPPAVPPAPGPV